MKPERNTLSTYTTFLIKLQNPISSSYYPSPRSKPIRQSPDEAHGSWQVCSNALIGAASKRGGSEGGGSGLEPWSVRPRSQAEQSGFVTMMREE